VGWAHDKRWLSRLVQWQGEYLKRREGNFLYNHEWERITYDYP